MREDLIPNSQVSPEPKTFGVVNIQEIHKSEEDRESETSNRRVLKNWLIKGLYITLVLVALGFWKKYFFYLAILPPILALFSWKVKTITEKMEKNNPI